MNMRPDLGLMLDAELDGARRAARGRGRSGTYGVEMNVTIKLLTTLKKFAPAETKGTIPMEFEAGATAKTAAAHFEIPEDFVGAVFIDGQRAELDTALADGMEVSFLAPIGGG